MCAVTNLHRNEWGTLLNMFSRSPSYIHGGVQWAYQSQALAADAESGVYEISDIVKR